MQWTLDSCGTTDNCIVEVDNNFNFVRFIHKCPTHQSVTDDTNGFNEIRAENQRGPSNTQWEILQRAPSTLFDTSPTGDRTFKQGINVTWNWTGTRPNRVLNVNITGVTPSTTQQNTIRTALNSRFGAGRVNLTFG